MSDDSLHPAIGTAHAARTIRIIEGDGARLAVPAGEFSLDTLVRPDLRFHYSTEVGAAAWLDVCRDPTYGHDRLVAAAVAVVPRLIGDWPGAARPFDVCSLGPGDGELDRALLERLLVMRSVRSFIGIDSSRALLDVAAETLAPLTAAQPEVLVSLMHADFVALRYDNVPAGDDVPRLFLLLGLTLGNYAEAGVLRHIRSLMRPGDRLAIDARVHAFGPTAGAHAIDQRAQQSLLAAYDRKESRRFAFAPVAAATFASADEQRVEYEVSQRYTDVPGALNVVSHVCDLDTRMRATGTPVRRARLDLGVTTAYDADALHQWLQSAGWRVVGRETADGVVRMLLSAQHEAM